MSDENKVQQQTMPAHARQKTQPPEPSQDSGIEPLLEEIRKKHGDALQAILVYGSWLRGKRDTMLDFYVLVENYRSLDSIWQGWLCRLLPPNVYHIHHKSGDLKVEGQELRAKYALLTLNRFHKAMRHDFHSYFWARFAQPCEVLYVRDEATQSVLTDAFNRAAATFVRRVLPTMGDRFSSKDLWTHGLSLTYQCEIRTETSKRGESIYDFNSEYYDRVTNAFTQPAGTLSESDPAILYCNPCSGVSRRFASFSWGLRRLQGKLLSLLRLLKAALTFNEPLEYLLWKIERHTGLYIEPSQRQLKYPLIFAWPLLWKLYRKGAFR